MKNSPGIHVATEKKIHCVEAVTDHIMFKIIKKRRDEANKSSIL